MSCSVVPRETCDSHHAKNHSSAMHREFAAVRKEISALTGRVARLEGILEGREAAVGDGA